MLVQATDTFRTPSRRIVRKGETFDATDPIVAAARGLFRPLVENATATPGEPRGGARRATPRASS